MKRFRSMTVMVVLCLILMTVMGCKPEPETEEQENTVKISGTAITVTALSPSNRAQPAVYVGILIVGTVVFAGIPFVIYAMRRRSWADPKAVAEFEPFSWEKK